MAHISANETSCRLVDETIGIRAPRSSIPLIYQAATSYGGTVKARGMGDEGLEKHLKHMLERHTSTDLDKLALLLRNSELYDAPKPKYGIDPTTELSSFVTGDSCYCGRVMRVERMLLLHWREIIHCREWFFRERNL